MHKINTKDRERYKNRPCYRSALEGELHCVIQSRQRARTIQLSIGTVNIAWQTFEKAENKTHKNPTLERPTKYVGSQLLSSAGYHQHHWATVSWPSPIFGFWWHIFACFQNGLDYKFWRALSREGILICDTYRHTQFGQGRLHTTCPAGQPFAVGPYPQSSLSPWLKFSKKSQNANVRYEY